MICEILSVSLRLRVIFARLCSDLVEDEPVTGLVERVYVGSGSGSTVVPLGDTCRWVSGVTLEESS